jgi:hypothetical protein
MNLSGQSPDQASSPSVEDRVAAIFADPPKAQKAQKQSEPEQGGDEGEAPQIEHGESAELSEESAPEPENSETDTFEFEHEGAKYALPKALEKAILNNRDYTQKTQSVAEQRKSFELLHEQARVANMQREFHASVHEEIQQLQAYDAVLKQPVDWSSMDTNEAFRRKLQIDQWKDEREAILKTVQAKHQEFTQKQEAAARELKTKLNELVSKRIPNWSEATQKAIREHAIADGYTEAEISSVSDPRMTLTLWKASQYDQLKAKATPAVNAVKTVKTTPSNPMPQHVKDKLNFRKALSKAQPGEKRKLVEARAAQIFSR